MTTLGRRQLGFVLLVAAALHLLGLARTSLPAQDGLKFLRIARLFQTQPAFEVIRSSDQHPLYPACIAALEPLFRTVGGSQNPAVWRLSAQCVSVLASFVTLLCLARLTAVLFDTHTGVLAAFLFAVLPIPCRLGHDTLSDMLALSLLASSLVCAEAALRRSSIALAGLSGLAAGLGFWTRPEVVLIVPAATLAWFAQRYRAWLTPRDCPRASLRVPLTVILAACPLVLGYTMVKGTLSEKLAIRMPFSQPSSSRHDRAVAHALPPLFQSGHWDFSAKEESEGTKHLSLPAAAIALATAWAGCMGWIPAILAFRGARRVPTESGGSLLLAIAGLYCGAILGHSWVSGYLSDRHTLALVFLATPWAAAGARDLWDHMVAWRAWSPQASRLRWQLLAASVLLIGAFLQAKPAHLSRSGHLAAGRWLQMHTTKSQAVLDTRGWASFVSGLPSYDYWHVRQALTDSRLSFIVVGQDELVATSPRASTLRALLAQAGQLAASFPGRPDGTGVPVLVYRLWPSRLWEEGAL